MGVVRDKLEAQRVAIVAPSFDLPAQAVLEAPVHAEAAARTSSGENSKRVSETAVRAVFL